MRRKPCLEKWNSKRGIGKRKGGRETQKEETSEKKRMKIAKIKNQAYKTLNKQTKKQLPASTG